jgi:nicotinate-nucleotide pyrophosphorylase (carboxylating)
MTVEFDNAARDCALRLITLALEEDLRDRGDLTSRALIDPDAHGAVQIVARRAGVLSGLPVAEMVLWAVDPQVQLACRRRDGAALSRGMVIADVSGPIRSLLTGERTALNFLTHLSGVATLTRQFVDAVAGTKATILDTRKTLPAWRALEKYAVRCGGGTNHRMGLYDGVLIKDNHVAAWCGSDRTHTLTEAVRQARDRSPAGVSIEIEVDSLDQLADALQGAPDIVLLDNMPPAMLREAVAVRDRVAPAVRLEASGGVSLETVRLIAESGVERISVGLLTHSAPALDLAFDWGAPAAGQ